MADKETSPDIKKTKVSKRKASCISPSFKRVPVDEIFTNTNGTEIRVSIGSLTPQIQDGKLSTIAMIETELILTEKSANGLKSSLERILSSIEEKKKEDEKKQ